MGLGYRTFVAGEVATAANVQGYLMKQAVMSFANAGTRDSVVTAPEEGMVAYTQDTDIYYSYTNAAWVPIDYAGAWTDYTPTWASSGTAPGLGNGTAAGRYKVSGKEVTFYAQIVLGTTSTVGTGSYTLSLPPITARTTIAQKSLTSFFDSSTGNVYMGMFNINATNTGLAVISNVAAGSGMPMSLLSATVPVVPAVGDAIYVQGVYEAA